MTSRRPAAGACAPALCALALALGALAGGAAQARGAERILLFETAVGLEREATFTVEERIVYDFGEDRRHGIFRDVPVRYGRGAAADYRIGLDVLSVSDGQGRPRPFELSRRGRSRRLRIGSPHGTVAGVQEYRIRYRVRRGILWFEDHDELYWNATGDQWQVPIERARAAVELPPGSASISPDALCFTGPRGSVASECAVEAGPGRLAFATRGGLAPGEGLTVVVALPKGLLVEPSRLSLWLDRASDWIGWSTALPLVVLVAMGTHWWRNGRDPEGAAATTVRYEPPEGMSPAEMGTVLDEQVEIRDVTGTILDLAVRGYLEIAEIPGTKFLFLSDSDWELRARRPADDALRGHERRLLEALLDGGSSVRLSSLRNAFYAQLPGLREALYEEVSRRGWFPGSPERMRRLYAAGAAVLLVAAALTGALAGSLAPALAVAACGGIVFAFGRHMPRKTKAGRRAADHIRGFAEFVRRVEADRLERLGVRSLSHFEALLPYAYVLDLADAWADAFDGLFREPPAWFHPAGGGPFRSRGFVNDLGRALDATGQTLASRPRSSGSGASGLGGGGFSGGGFGGGGGGSW